MDQIEKFVKDSGVSIPAYNVCFYDSNGTDEILDNILCGKKRANTGLFSLFEAQMQLLPRTGDYTVVLDSDMQPRCITRTTKIVGFGGCVLRATYPSRQGCGAAKHFRGRTSRPCAG